ncbi:MAG TPA: hypothetical protein VG797_00350 [Phycisphaerales bacterium]|nr:hypothetical protein [Phycisphaerales bacterium]
MPNVSHQSTIAVEAAHDTPRAGESASPHANADTTRAGATDVREAMMRDLSHEERLLMILWHAEKMTRAEIAAVLHTTAEQVVNMHDMIIERLRRTVVTG